MTATSASDRGVAKAPRILLAVEQLRRDVPGGIGTYTRGLLQGLVQLAIGPSPPALRGPGAQDGGARHGPADDAGGVSAPPGPAPIVVLGLLASRAHTAGSTRWTQGRRSDGAGALPSDDAEGDRRADPLGRFGWPVHASRLPGRLLTRAWDHGLVGAPGGYDVVHAVSQAAPPVRGRHGHIRPALVVTVHDLAWRRHPASSTARGRRWHEASLARALEHADAFVVPSGPVAEDLIAAGADPSRVAIIGEGSDHLAPPDEAGASELLARHGVHGGYLLSVSTLEPRKNLAGLVEAYEQARPSLPGGLPLVVVGPQGWGEATVEPGATRPWSEVLGAPGVVHVGPVSDGVLAALYSGARTFVYVPFVEGFGLPPLEAMRQGAPVVASTGVPSVAIRPDRPPTAMLVDPTDPAAVAAALVAVTTDDALRAALADAGSHDAAGRTWREAAEAHVALWTSLARGVR